MAYEIELKAWAGRPEETEKKLDALARRLFSFYKEDVYWYGEDRRAFPSGVRVRREERRMPDGARRALTLVTYKIKETRDAVEVNDEKEFAVDGGADASDGAGAFEGLLSRAGLRPGFSKKKSGARWEYRAGAEGMAVGAELSRVGGLGHFVELEILAGADSPLVVERARAELYRLLDALGIPGDRVESRYYSELLDAAGR